MSNVIAELLEEHREEIGRLLQQSLDAIEEAFEARRVYVRRGQVLMGGPDHYMRLRAVTVVTKLINAVGWAEMNRLCSTSKVPAYSSMPKHRNACVMATRFSGGHAAEA